MLRIKLVKSPIGNTRQNRATVQALGLRKVRQVVEHNDHPSIRGMIHKVKHLLEIEEVSGEVAPRNTKPKASKPAEKKAVAKAPVKAAKKAAKSADIAPGEPVEAGTEGAAPAKAPAAKKPADKKPAAKKPAAAKGKKK